MSKDPFLLNGKKIFITGASSGIGRSIAVKCAGRGAELHLGGRNEDKLNETLSLLHDPSKHTCLRADLNQDEAIHEMVNQLPKLDGLVLNAGFTKTVPVKFVSRDFVDKIFNVNLQSSIILLQQLLRKKKLNQGAAVTLISSVASVKPTIGNAVYSASKGGVNAFTKALALELAPKHIRVNAVLPGFVKTSILESSGVSEEQLKQHQAKYPIGRFGEPEDIAHLVLYLLSDASTWMTGSLLRIDGGFSL